MKKALMIVAIVLTIILALWLIACSQKTSQKTTQDTIKTTQKEKQYEIKIYSCEPKFLAGIGVLAKEGNMTTVQLIKLVVENPDRSKTTRKIYDLLNLKIYYAKEVKDFSDTNARFIDNTGKEQFISADYITISQTQ
ncbi:MAG: hypothetical protein ACYDIA_00675 [Candidatus Humimicrobiaceae bacterium]